MPQMSSKVAQAETSHTARRSAAGSNGAALSPPAYGIDFADRQVEPDNKTGLPDRLKAGIENLSGLAMDDVRVHYNSSKPAELQALAYTRGTDIFVGPGQERHLPHEAWHVVQQKEGRVRPTTELAGMAVNDDPSLEKEADIIAGARALPLVVAAGPLAATASMPGVAIQLNGKGKLVETSGGKYKKKKKERSEQAKVERTLDEQIHDWIESYGHSIERHAGLTTAQLDGRNIPLATTFDTPDDLFLAAKDLITVNERKLNDWHNNTDKGSRLTLWGYRGEEIRVRGRRKRARPEWHYHQTPMPAHPGFEDVDEEDLQFVIGIFDRDFWNNNPKGLVTCYPSDGQP